MLRKRTCRVHLHIWFFALLWKNFESFALRVLRALLWESFESFALREFWGNLFGEFGELPQSRQAWCSVGLIDPHAATRASNLQFCSSQYLGHKCPTSQQWLIESVERFRETKALHNPKISRTNQKPLNALSTTFWFRETRRKRLRIPWLWKPSAHGCQLMGMFPWSTFKKH